MALEFLQERYGTYFQVVKVARDTLFGGTPHGVVVTSLDHPECDEFTVHWDRQWWQDTFDDTYLYCSMEHHYSDLVKRTVAFHFPEHHTTIRLPMTGRQPQYPDMFNGETTFEEFYQWGKAVISIDVIIGIPTIIVSDFDTDSFSLESELQEIFPVGSLNLTLLEPDNYQLWVDFEDPSPDHYSSTDETRWDIPQVDGFFHEWGK